MKRIVLLTLACLLLLLPCACSKTEEPVAPEEGFGEEAAQSEPSIGLPSPMHDMESYAALLAAQPGNMLSDAPAGATDISYCYIDGEPVISQIKFTYEENAYTYRSAAAASASEAERTDIAGVYYDLNKSKDVTVPDGDALGGTYTLKFMQGSTNGLATWYYLPTGCQYSLWTETGCDNTQAVEKVAALLLPIGVDAYGNPIDIVTPTDDPASVVSSVTGTVTALQSNVITVQLVNKSTLQFKLNNIPATNVNIGDTVTITYSGNPLDTPEALTLTVTGAAPVTPTPTPTEDPNKDADKTVTGYVTNLTSNRVSVYLDASHTYTFKYDSTTVITGNYSLAYGCRVSVFYKGYASNSPVAKRVDVLAPPAPVTPTPAPTQAPTATPYNPPVYNITGMVSMHAGNALVVQANDGSEYSFLLRAPRIVGDIYEGSLVKLTYQVEADGSLNATYIEDVTPILYSEAPEADTSDNDAPDLTGLPQ